MPVLQTKIEGRGNGIKTVIPNMEDVARALARPPTCESYISFQYYLSRHLSLMLNLRHEIRQLMIRPRQVFWL
jgi:hypothetical protein